jgi:hypothetical protein
MPSSAILAMQYDPALEELLITFRGGRGTYRYFNVPIEEWKAFLDAESKGTYLNRVFKPKEYSFERAHDTIRSSGQRPVKPRLEWGEPEIPRKDAKRVEVPDRIAKVRAL